MDTRICEAQVPRLPPRPVMFDGVLPRLVVTVNIRLSVACENEGAKWPLNERS